jgi:high-affinity Fe2+/Pb2+ permease
MLAGDVGLVAWGTARDNAWVQAARRHCTHFDLPPLPDNWGIGWAVVVSVVVAVLAVCAGAVLYARAARYVGAWIFMAPLVFLTVVVGAVLLLFGSIMIEPRHLSTGMDGSGLPCPFG